MGAVAYTGQTAHESDLAAYPSAGESLGPESFAVAPHLCGHKFDECPGCRFVGFANTAGSTRQFSKSGPFARLECRRGPDLARNMGGAAAGRSASDRG